nr:hypothetical protein [Candidatus Sigynarchaeota archaeon]
MPITIQVRSKTVEQTSVSKFKAILKRHVQARCGCDFIFDERARTVLHLEIEPGSQQDGFTIRDDDNGLIMIVGGNFRSIVYGLGKLLRTSTFAPGRFTASSWRGTSVPQNELRAVYFATHFFNFYHAAPVEKIVEYVEDLALWGFNAVVVCYDMHHLTGIDTPEARRFIDRLKAILTAAKETGLRPGLTMLANEGYANSPVELRADQSFPGTRHIRGGYGVELCTSKPAGKKLALQWLGEEFQAFSSIDIELIMLWPYDQGGCCCPECRPWGANGFVGAAKDAAILARQYFPRAKIILSTWLFDPGVDEGEWRGLTEKLSAPQDWVDYILADSHEAFPKYPLGHGVPGNLPLLNFPEISMWGMNPWGGYGANPLPGRFQAFWDVIRDKLSGGVLYSEGLYEDVNKIIWAQFYWDSARTARETLREYVAYEFPGCNVDEVAEGIMALEEGHREFSTRKRWRLKLRSNARAQKVANMFDRETKLLPTNIARSWRWRILCIRASLDLERFTGKRYPNAAVKAWFDELTAIYHAQDAEGCVRPPRLETGGKKLVSKRQ